MGGLTAPYAGFWRRDGPAAAAAWRVAGGAPVWHGNGMRAGRVVILALAAALCPCTGVAAAAESPDCGSRRWLGAWEASPTDAPPISYAGRTVRLVVTPTIGGRSLRVRLSNRFSGAPLEVDSAFVARQLSGPALAAGSSARLSFGGRAGVSVPAGGEAVSDPVRLRFRAFDRLAVSLYVSPSSTGAATEHYAGMQTSFVAPAGAGDVAASESGAAFTGTDATTTTARPILAGVEVRAGSAAGGVVAFGDSLTDGMQGAAPGEGVDEDARYPDFLARRLLRGAKRRRFSVMNAGISGNSLRFQFLDYYGPPAPRRLRRDVIEQPGVTDVIVMEGRNDLALSEPPAVILSLRRIVARLKARGLNVLLGTITPGLQAGTPAADTIETEGDRRAINRWIRGQRVADAVVDFDRAIRDPSDLGEIRPRLASSDGLHPSSAGYRAMAEAVDLGALAGAGCAGTGS